MANNVEELGGAVFRSVWDGVHIFANDRLRREQSFLHLSMIFLLFCGRSHRLGKHLYY